MAGYIGKILLGKGTPVLIGSTLYGVCSTSAGTAAKVIGAADDPSGKFINTNYDNFVLGGTIHVKFINGNDVASGVTLTVGTTTATTVIGKCTCPENTIISFTLDERQRWVVNDNVDRNIMMGTSAEWNAQYNYIAPRGTILIYSDHGTITETINGTEVTKIVPGIKITDGSTPVIDLPFVGDDEAAALYKAIDDHIKDTTKHITAAERIKWNNKLNCEDTVQNNNLILTRN